MGRDRDEDEDGVPLLPSLLFRNLGIVVVRVVEFEVRRRVSSWCRREKKKGERGAKSLSTSVGYSNEMK